MFILSTLVSQSSSLSSFGHLFEMAFDCGIAYAVLIRTGYLQGQHIENYCIQRNREVTEAKNLLTAESSDLGDRFDVGGNKLRCDNHVAKCKKQIYIASRRFSAAGLLVSVLCALTLLVSIIWEPVMVPNWAILVGFLLAFAPVPGGIACTYYYVQRAESRIALEYRDFFIALGVLKAKLNDETNRAMQEITARRSIKKPNFFQRLFTNSE